MTKVFADTSFWVAVLNPRDSLHTVAVDAWQRVTSAMIVTSEMVLVELLNGFSEKNAATRKAAVSAIEEMQRDSRVKIIPQSSHQFREALWRYRVTTDKGWSATDCASFALMEAEQIQSALTYDRHFVQAGFRALLR